MAVPTGRFMRRGVSRVYHVPTVASATLVPTVAEITAGTELTDDLADLAGFTFSNSPIAVPDWGDNFDSKITGVDTVTDGTLTLYEKGASNPLRTTLAKGTEAYIAIFFAGTAGAAPAAADKCEVWPVTYSGPAREYTTGAEGAKWSTAAVASARPNVDAALTA